MSALPKTYRAAVVNSAGANFQVIERPLQPPGDGEVLVKVLACGLCAGDTHLKDGHFPGITYPRVPGHEVVGNVAAVGRNVSGEWSVGQRVGLAWHGGHCGKCTLCRQGKFNFCDKATITGMFNDGGYAEYLIARHEALVHVPEELDPAETAPLLCAGLTTYNALRNMDAKPGDVVAVQGIGGLGHLALQYAVKCGYHTVAVSSSASKHDLALQLGAHDYIDTSTTDPVEHLMKLGGAKLIMATAPNASAIEKIMPGLAVGGTLVFLAVSGNVSVSPALLVGKAANVRGWASGTPGDAEDTLKFSRLTGIKTLVEKYRLNDVENAYASMVQNKARFRSVLVFD